MQQRPPAQRSPSGAPAATAASRTMRAASMVHFLARGCGHSTCQRAVEVR